jgi:hypothetical protein
MCQQTARNLITKLYFELEHPRSARPEPSASWLEGRLQLDQGSLPRAVLRLTPVVAGFEQLLGSKMEDNLEPTLVWLQNKLTLDDAGLIQRSRNTHRFLA